MRAPRTTGAFWASVTVWLLALPPAVADTTTGGVTWLDPLGYQKPAFLPITVPNEAGVSNKYYVDLSSGSGTTCSFASPCASLSSVAGKAGTTGGPAYIYVKGSGALGAPVLYGTAGNEVVIKPWDDATQATFTGRNNWTQRVQYVIFDGGPNLRIRFTSTSGSQFDPSLYLNHSTAGQQSHVTFARTQWDVPGLGTNVAQWGCIDNFAWINSEFHSESSSDSGNQHHMYFSGASSFGCSATATVIRHNIFRDEPGEAIELRLFETNDGMIIDGNAFHDLGKGTCSQSWKCRGAITLSDDGGGTLSNIRISNNLFWDTGEGSLRAWAGTPLIYGNTMYNWGMGSPVNGQYSTAAISNYAFTNPPGSYANNIFWASGSDASGNDKQPYPPSATTGSKNNNACESGETCGTSSQVVSGASFVSLDENNSGFLKLASGSTPIDNGADLSATFTTSYFGISRPQGAAFDIGAQEFSTGGINGALSLTEAADTVTTATTTLAHAAAAVTEAADTPTFSAGQETHGVANVTEGADALAATGSGAGTCVGWTWIITSSSGPSAARHVVGNALQDCVTSEPTLLCDRAQGQIWTMVNAGVTTQVQRRNKQWVACP
jgi:hypothetical protein